MIGTGNIGEVIIKELRDAGYPVKMANARGPEWRQQPGSPVYCTNPTKEELQFWLENVDRSSLAADREKGSKAYYALLDAHYQAQIKAFRALFISPAVEQKKSWRETGGHADTTEAAERALVLAARYPTNPSKVAQTVSSNCLLTQADEVIAAMTTGCAWCTRASCHFTRSQAGSASRRSWATLIHRGPDASPLPTRWVPLLTTSYMAEAAPDPGVEIEPAWKVSIVYGMPCAIYHQLPAAYYLAARFHDDFEGAVLHALNGGGQNQARCILTGALVGAQVGLSRIPQRFLAGLENASASIALARQLGRLAERAA